MNQHYTTTVVFSVHKHTKGFDALHFECSFSFCPFDSDFEELLTLLHWPSISPPIQPLAPPANAQEISSQLDLLVSQLMALQTSYPSKTKTLTMNTIGVVGHSSVQCPIVVSS